MAHLFESERLFYREFDIKDAESFYMLNKDEEVMKYTGDLPFKSVEDSLNLIKNYSAYRDTGFGRWTVISKADNSIIGWCGLKRHADESVDLGYRFHKGSWGKGYGYEAANRCIEYGFKKLELDEIIGRTANENKASVKILEKIGMKFWKFAPCEGIENSVYYKITRNEFNQL